MGRTKLYTALSVLFWLSLWQLGAMAANARLLLPLPTPLSTALALWRLLGTGSFYAAVGASLLRVGLGFLLAFVLGTLCALLSARSSFFKLLTAPLLSLIRAIPVASFTILIFLWVSREKIPSCISFLTVFPVVWASVENGAVALDRGLREMARVFGMPAKRILREITLPALRPFFAAAAANGIGFAWKAGVAAEIICRTASSLGNLLWAGKSSVEYDEVFAVTLVIVLLSALLQGLAGQLLKGGARHA